MLRPQHLSIRWKIILPFLLLALVVLVVLLPLTSALVERELSSEADNRLRQNVDSAARLIEQAEARVLQDADFVASQRDVVLASYDPDATQLDRVLTPRRQEFDIQELSFYTPDYRSGTPAFYYGGPTITRPLQVNDETEEVRARLIQESLLTGQPSSGIVISPRAAQIIGVAPIRGESPSLSEQAGFDRNITGLVVAVRYLDNTFFQEVSSILGTNIALVKENAIIASTIPAETSYDRLSEEGLLFPQGDFAALNVEDDGEIYRLLASRVELSDSTSATLIVSEPVSELFQVQENIQAMLAIFALLVGTVSIAVGIFTMGRLAQPLARLAEATSRVKDGYFNQRVPINERGITDEITLLNRNFNAMAERLQNMYAELEGRIDARTRDLQVAMDVSRRVATVMDQDILLPQLVDLTRTSFNLYHVSIFLYDNETDHLNLSAASGVVGQRMLAQGRTFHLTDEIGLVPLSARRLEPVLVNDVTQSSRHAYNPFVPKTCSELAVPMVIGTKLIGVLDLQAEETNRFTMDDLRIMGALADQFAVAVQNAHSFSEQVNIAEQLRAVDHMKSQFLASMSHELRTPLNAIINFTQFVASGMLGQVNPQQAETLGKAVQSGEHLLSLINDILDITKIEADKLELFVQEVNISKEVQAVADMAETLIGSKSVRMVLAIQPDLPTIHGDKRRLRQIFLNLVSNAAKFTEKGSITIRAYTEDDHLIFAVQDTGPGIAPEDQPLIFEAFRQEKSGLSHGSGTGLGLPISKRLAEAHDGALWLESEVGKGTTFYVSLPLHSQKVLEMMM